MDKFDCLRKWFSLDADVLASQYDDSAKNVIKELLVELADQDSQRIEVTEDSFPSLVSELYELFVLGSKEFGKSLLIAEDLVLAGRLDEAISELNEFIEWTPSNFYKSMATKQIERFQRTGN
jgi:hypothetical protein